MIERSPGGAGSGEKPAREVCAARKGGVEQ